MQPFCVILVNNLWHGLLESPVSQTSSLPGNYPRPSNYSGTASTNYSGPGPGMTNSLAMNASSPMHGQGPGQPIPVGRSQGPGNHNRVYPTMAPSSPSMPQTAGPGMGPPSLGSSNRKAGEGTAATMPVSANSTHNRYKHSSELRPDTCMWRVHVHKQINVISEMQKKL